MILEVKKTTKAKLQKYYGGITNAIMTIVKFIAGGITESFNFDSPITQTFNFRSDATDSLNFDSPATLTFNFRSDVQ